MPNPRGRGRRSTDAHHIVDADFDATTNAITVVSADRATLRRLSLPADRLGSQLAAAIWAQIPQAGTGGRWASTLTLHRGVRRLQALHGHLTSRGVSDLADVDAATLFAARDAVHPNPLTRGAWRSVRVAVADALREHHPDGRRLARTVLNEKLDSTIPNPWTAYPDGVADRIETLARDRYTRWYVAHRDLLQQAGVDVGDRDWILLGADEILGRLPDPPPVVTAVTPLAEQVAYAAAHGAAHPDGPDRETVDAGLWATADDLAAALVTMCLADNTGDNLSTMRTLTADSVVHVSDTAAQTYTEKARAATEIVVAASTADISSYSGVATTLIGLTRFTRRWRAIRLDRRRPHLDALAELVFVPHAPDPSAATLVVPGGTGFAAEVLAATGESLNFPRLRKTALYRSERDTGQGRITGQSERTRRQYLAHMVPDDDLPELVVEAQDEIIAAARAHLDHRPDAATASPRVVRLAAENPDRLVDVGVATCANHGDDPDTDEPCGRGILGCFVCPAGYVTRANIVGLKAATIFAERVRDLDPAEYHDGEAGLLDQLCRARLDQFPRHMVDDVTDDRARSYLPLIGALYTELRT